jgi:outer membrane protein assembly factor BamB
MPPGRLSMVYKRAAEFILAESGMNHTGNCIVFGAGEGRLAHELAKKSQLRIVGIEEDKDKVAKGRRALHAAGVYGDRVTLHQGSLSTLPYEDYAAALVVSDSIIASGACTGSAAEMFRMVRPDGGVAFIGQPSGCPTKLRRTHLEQWLKAGGLKYTITSTPKGLWARLDRGPLPGAGEWTHMWADVANTACSGDTRMSPEFRVLWYGEPGPRVLVERHARAMAPLYKHGRLIIPGAHRVICLDAYNGARLWGLEIEDSSRVAIDQDCGWIVLGDEYVYIAARNECMKVDVRTGKVAATFRPPTKQMDWGYLAIDGGQLLGSEQVRDASVIRGTGGNHWRTGHGDNKDIVTSRALFSLDPGKGALRWRYAGGGVILNPTICMDDEAVYFFESRNAKSVSDSDGRIGLADLTSGASEFIVKLDRGTGKPVWRHQRDGAFRHGIYLAYADGVLLASGCRTDGKYVYDFHAFSAKDCTPLWDVKGISSGKVNDSHGYQDKHPKIIGKRVVHRYGAFDLHTGKKIANGYKSSNCSDASASTTYLFTRNGGRACIQPVPGVASGRSRSLDGEIRPGCYINIIPAGGLIMLPAASCGCTCDYPVQMSLAWLPTQPGGSK